MALAESIITGGLATLGGLFGGGGPSDEEIAIQRARLGLDDRRLKFDERRFDTGEQNRRGALDFSSAIAAAQRLLRNDLLGAAAGAAPRAVNASSLFQDPTNAFSSPVQGGMASLRQGPDPLAPLDLNPAGLNPELPERLLPPLPAARPRRRGRSRDPEGDLAPLSGRN